MSPPVQLISYVSSPFAHRAEAALCLKGVPYKLMMESDLVNGKSELLLSLNPVHEKVPVLIHGDRAICESLVIVEYVDEAFEFDGPLLLPTDAYSRAMARFCAHFIDDKVREAFVKETKEAQLQGKRFFGGDRPGYLDIAAAVLGQTRVAIEEVTGVALINDQDYPALSEWAREYIAYEALKPCMPDRNKLVDYFNKTKEWYQATAKTTVQQ